MDVTLGAVLSFVLTPIVMLATIYVAASYLLRFGMLLVAALEVRRQRWNRTIEMPEAAVVSELTRPVSVLIPAHNEEQSICRTVQSLLAQALPPFEIIVISDGSTDRTLAVLHDAFELYLVNELPVADIPTQNVRAVFRSRLQPALKVIDKRNGGKADALNVGINYSHGRLLCVIDADVVLDRWALYYLSVPFTKDEKTIASCGTIRLHNGCPLTPEGVQRVDLPPSLLERLQIVEYTLAFGIGRMFFNLGDSHVVISGAFGLFSRQAVLEVGGFQANAIGEDMEIVVRLQRQFRQDARQFRIVFVADAVCYTEAPETLKELGNQRTRWHQGLLTTLRLHRQMIGRPRYGAVGLFTLPYFLLFELWSPVVEVLGWLTVLIGTLTGLVDGRTTLTFIGVTFVLGTTLSWAGIFLDDIASSYFRSFRQVLALALYAVLDNLGYHQVMLYFRLRAFVRYYRGVHLKGGWISPQRIAAARQARDAAPAGERV
ncbi:MAG TPA: glycosyltransferase [Thermoanaerobaculia bacterium]|nr:glycosyltransferase [Thermoanaerobaculia bacterium]